MSSALLDPSGTRDSRIPEVDSETHELGVYVNVVMMDGSFGDNMAGFYNIFGKNDTLSQLEEHANCDVIIDGSNLQFCFSLRSHALSNLPSYEQAVRNFFKHLLDANIRPLVFFDGPAKNDPLKWERGRERRQERLDVMISRTSSFERLEFPQPIAIQDIFRDVIHSLDIPSIQVSAKRDYKLEMVTQAKYLNAFLISGNTTFFVENIPRGYVCPLREQLENFKYESRCIMRTFRFNKLSQLINLAGAKNRFALIMWAVVLLHRKIFDLFTKPFFGRTSSRPAYYPKGPSCWIVNLFSQKSRLIPQLKLLQFFLDHTREDAERIICERLYPGQRKEAKLLIEDKIAAQLVEPHDVFGRLERELGTGEFCEEVLPLWFLRYLTVECKLVPAILDTLTDRRHHLSPLMEDFEKDSVNKTTLRLRRIMYGILFSGRGDSDEVVTVSELDRVGGALDETDQTPIWLLWDPELPSGTREVPGLRKMELVPESERLELFLLSMGVEKSVRREIDSDKTLYVLAILRYWIVANDDVKEKDLLRVLLTVLAVEQEYSKLSHVFMKPVNLNKGACSDLKIEFHPSSVSSVSESFACMHPLALLQNTILFGRKLHRLFMQPLGANSDAKETITSEVAFHHVCKRTKHLSGEELRALILHHMDEESGRNFTELVEWLWDEDAMSRGRTIVRGFCGDDKRP